MKKPTQFSPEVRERAVRMVVESRSQHESEWAAIVSIAAKIGCTGETLRKWVRQQQRDTGQREGMTTDEARRIKELEREVRELRKANEILKLASALLVPSGYLRRRSSTADSSREGLHQSTPSSPRGRADLQSLAGRPVGLPASCRPATSSSIALRPQPA